MVNAVQDDTGAQPKPRRRPLNFPDDEHHDEDLDTRLQMLLNIPAAEHSSDGMSYGDADSPSPSPPPHKDRPRRAAAATGAAGGSSPRGSDGAPVGPVSSAPQAAVARQHSSSPAHQEQEQQRWSAPAPDILYSHTPLLPGGLKRSPEHLLPPRLQPHQQSQQHQQQLQATAKRPSMALHRSGSAPTAPASEGDLAGVATKTEIITQPTGLPWGVETPAMAAPHGRQHVYPSPALPQVPISSTNPFVPVSVPQLTASAQLAGARLSVQLLLPPPAQHMPHQHQHQQQKAMLFGQSGHGARQEAEGRVHQQHAVDMHQQQYRQQHRHPGGQHMLHEQAQHGLGHHQQQQTYYMPAHMDWQGQHEHQQHYQQHHHQHQHMPHGQSAALLHGLCHPARQQVPDVQCLADQHNMPNSTEFAAVLGLNEPALSFTAAYSSQQLGSSSGLQLPAATSGAAAASAGGPCDTAVGAGAPHMLPLAPPYHHQQQGQGQGQQHHWNPEAHQGLQPPSLVQFQPPWSAHTTTLQPPALLPLPLSMADPLLHLSTATQQPYISSHTQGSPPAVAAAGDAVTYGGGGMGGCSSAAAAAAGGGGLLAGVSSRAELLQVTNACLHSLLDMRLAVLMVPAQAAPLQGARAHLLAQRQQQQSVSSAGQSSGIVPAGHWPSSPPTAEIASTVSAVLERFLQLLDEAAAGQGLAAAAARQRTHVLAALNQLQQALSALQRAEAAAAAQGLRLDARACLRQWVADNLGLPPQTRIDPAVSMLVASL